MTMKINPTCAFSAFAALYCETQVCTPHALHTRLADLRSKYNPDGFMLLECQMLDSSRMGERTILPYGPRNTFMNPPAHPLSPRGLASDMSVVVATMPATALDEANSQREGDL